ncbi:hypothetical protein TNCV_3100631 [Trichonephila clavipes]|nr:hypothetical protein TNCV_3100631 [Trichonephila clavipes]
MYGAFAAGSTLNSRRSTSPLVMLIEGGREVGGSLSPQGVLPQNLGGTEQNRTVTCIVLKAKAYERCKNLVASRDEFCGP